MRVDISKEMVRADIQRIDSVKYLLAERPEFMDMTPIYDIVSKALAQGKDRK
jgi:hypothetical protein